MGLMDFQDYGSCLIEDYFFRMDVDGRAFGVDPLSTYKDNMFGKARQVGRSILKNLTFDCLCSMLY